MMVNRRSFLAAPAGAFLWRPTAAMAQAVEPPKFEDLANVAREPEQYRQALIGLDTLRLVLILRLLELNHPSSDPQRDLQQYVQIRSALQDPAFRAEVEHLLSTDEYAEIVVQTVQAATPTAVRIQNFLAEGGVSGPLGRDMVRGFYIIVLLKAVEDRKPVTPTEAWYCQFYPFSYFCH